ncbi:MAG: C25 family cysteine peptidase, partial [Candidatus Eiseniibacteriota bacterium]
AVPLPTRTIFLRVPDGAAASVSGSPGPVRSLGLLRPVPFARLLSDPTPRLRVDATTVGAALSGPAYSARQARAPAPPVVSVRDLFAGGARLLAVTLRPVTWDAATGEASALSEIVLDVRWDRPVEALAPGAALAAQRLGLAPNAAVGPVYAAAAKLRRGGTVAPLRRAVGALATSPARVDPSRPWVRLGVLRPGLYLVSPADLAGAGVAVGAIDPATFRIFRATPGDLPESVDVDLGPDSLRECAIEVTGSVDGTFDPSDRIYFYATGATGFGNDLSLGGGTEYQEAQHSDEESLWLTWGPGAGATPPRRIPTRSALPVTVGAPLDTVLTHRVHFEANRLPNFNLYQPPYRWERWFDRLLSQGARVPFFLQLPGAAAGGAGDVRVRMWGLGNSLGSGVADHVARIYWHKVLADTAGWDLAKVQDLAAAGLTIGTRDTLEVEVPVLKDPFFPDPPYARFDQSYLAWFEITYPRRLTALNDTIQFVAPDSTSGPVQYTIGQVSDTTSAWLLDRTDPESPVRLSGAWTGAAPNFRLTVEDSLGPSRRPRYSLLSLARAARPSTVARYAPAVSARTISDLLDPGNGADYLIIAPAAFLAAAETLAVYREAKLPGIPSPRVRIATVDRVFAQFGSGRPVPTAIRNFIVYASRHWAGPPPSYVCLLGDATSDPKNYFGIGAPDWIPTYSNYFDPNTLTQFTSDDFYAFLDGPGDKLADVVLGRLPAGNASEALALATTKLRTYENTSDFDLWRTRAVLAADDANKRDQPDPLGNDHVSQME